MYGKIFTEIHDATSGEESGMMGFLVASHDGGVNQGLSLTGGDNDNEVDVTVGLGAASITTIAGLLTMGSTAAMDNAGLLTVGDANAAKNTSSNVFGDYIRLLPSDFSTNEDGGNTKHGIGYVSAAGANYGIKVPSADTEIFAFVSIPEGMTATDVEIFGKRTRGVEVFEVQINDTTAVSKGTGNCNTEFSITNVASTATNLLAIEVDTASTSADRVYGGRVKIAAT